MKALVTGGTGFVGSHIVRALTEQGHSARVLHRRSSKLLALEGLDYESALGDITDPDSLRAACAGCDWVFHVAAVADYWRADREHMFRVNVDGTRAVLDAAREAGVKRVVFTSSTAAVGLREDAPTDESVPFNLPVERFPYGYSKVLAEAACQEAVAAGQEVVIVNPVIVIGPGDLNQISGSFVLQTARLQWLTPTTSGGAAFIDVRDVAAAHIAAAERGTPGERYLLSTANYSYDEWFAIIADVLDVARPRLRTPDFVLPPLAAAVDGLARLGISLPVDANQIRLGARNVFVDASKAHNQLGPPRIDMHQSLHDTYDWYRKHGYIEQDTVTRFIARMGRAFGMR